MWGTTVSHRGQRGGPHGGEWSGPLPPKGTTAASTEGNPLASVPTKGGETEAPPRPLKYSTYSKRRLTCLVHSFGPPFRSSERNHGLVAIIPWFGTEWPIGATRR